MQETHPYKSANIFGVFEPVVYGAFVNTTFLVSSVPVVAGATVIGSVLAIKVV
jgi:hypothetical protein